MSKFYSSAAALILLFFSFSQSIGQALYPPSNFACRLNIVYSGNPQVYDETVVYFNSASSDGFFPSEDAPKFPQTNALMIYSMIGSQMLAINAMGSLTQEKFVDIGYQVPSGSTVSISYTPVGNEIDNFNGNAVLELIDLNLGIVTNLLTTSTYTFSSASGTTNNRFRLHFAACSYAFVSPGSCSAPGNMFITNFGLTPVDYQVTDINSNLLVSGTAFNGISPLNLPYPGPYFYNYSFPGQPANTAGYTLIPDFSADLPQIDVIFLSDTSINIDAPFEADASWTGVNLSQDSLRWDFGDGNSYWGFSAYHTYPAPGNYTITMTAYGDSCTSTRNIQVLVYNITGESHIRSGTLTGYFNDLQYTWKNESSMPVSGIWTVFDLAGKQIQEKNLTLMPRSTNSFQMPELGNGIYLSVLRTTEKTYTEKFSVQHAR